MTLTINLPPELEKKLEEHAARKGQDIGTFVLQAVQKIAKDRMSSSRGAGQRRD